MHNRCAKHYTKNFTYITSSNLFFFFNLTFFPYLFIFWPHCTACRILVLWPEIEPEPGPPGVEAQSPNHWTTKWFPRGFPGGSVGKESTCNARDPCSIPGSGSSPREGIGYPLQYYWASLVAQLVKNPPAMWETWVQSLGWEDPLEEGMATHSSILAWRIPMDRGAWWTTVHGVSKSQTHLSD